MCSKKIQYRQMIIEGTLVKKFFFKAWKKVLHGLKLEVCIRTALPQDKSENLHEQDVVTLAIPNKDHAH